MEHVEDHEVESDIRVTNSSDLWIPNVPVTKSVDEFNVENEDILKIHGMGTSFRRKVSREIQKRFVGIDGAQTQQNLLQQAITGYAMFDLVQPTYNLEYLSRIYEISPYNYAAINAKVSNIVGLGFDFVETRKTNEAIDAINSDAQLERARKKLNRLRQDLHDWLEDCNEEETFKETLIKFYTDVEATGNGYLEIGRTSAGKIGYIGHIPAKTMRVRRLRDGFIQLLYGKAVFFRNFGDEETENPISGGLDRPNEIIHFKKYTPMNNYYGIPDIVAAQNAMAGNEYVPLPADSPDNKVEFKMEPVEAGVQDSSFNTYRRSNRDEILLSHRVPINKIGTPEGINLAAARDADKTFREQVCRPAQDILEKKLNKMISEMTDALTLKFNELTLTDEDTQSKIDERYLRMQVITPNEVRIRKGMVPIDGGDNVVELKPQQQSEIRTQANGNRLRDQNRKSNSPDLSGEGRNAQGDGRQVD